MKGLSAVVTREEWLDQIRIDIHCARSGARTSMILHGMHMELHQDKLLSVRPLVQQFAAHAVATEEEVWRLLSSMSEPQPRKPQPKLVQPQTQPQTDTESAHPIPVARIVTKDWPEKWIDALWKGIAKVRIL